MITTPLAPLDPYIAVAEASFSTSMLSISVLFKTVGLLPKIGKPSTTYSGSLLPCMELAPRIRTFKPAPGAPVVGETCTPAARPDKDWRTLVDGKALISLAPTWATEPVRSDRLCVP